MKKRLYLFSVLIVLFCAMPQVGSAQSVGLNGVYAGSYSLDFKGFDEAKFTVQIPEGFQSLFLGGTPGSWPSYNYGITGFYIPPCVITRYEFLGSEIIFWVRIDMWGGEEKIQLIMNTNKPYPYSPYGYYFLYADVNVMN